MLVKDVGMQREMLAGWMRRVGQALLTAYGRLPLADVQVWLVSVDNLSIAGRFFRVPASGSRSRR
jgi:hypothetical protein